MFRTPLRRHVALLLGLGVAGLGSVAAAQAPTYFLQRSVVESQSGATPSFQAVEQSLLTVGPGQNQSLDQVGNVYLDCTDDPIGYAWNGMELSTNGTVTASPGARYPMQAAYTASLQAEAGEVEDTRWQNTVTFSRTAMIGAQKVKLTHRLVKPLPDKVAAVPEGLMIFYTTSNEFSVAGANADVDARYEAIHVYSEFTGQLVQQTAVLLADGEEATLRFENLIYQTSEDGRQANNVIEWQPLPLGATSSDPSNPETLPQWAPAATMSFAQVNAATVGAMNEHLAIQPVVSMGETPYYSMAVAPHLASLAIFQAAGASLPQPGTDAGAYDMDAQGRSALAQAVGLPPQDVPGPLKPCPATAALLAGAAIGTVPLNEDNVEIDPLVAAVPLTAAAVAGGVALAGAGAAAAAGGGGGSSSVDDIDQPRVGITVIDTNFIPVTDLEVQFTVIEETSIEIPDNCNFDRGIATAPENLRQVSETKTVRTDRTGLAEVALDNGATQIAVSLPNLEQSGWVLSPSGIADSQPFILSNANVNGEPFPLCTTYVFDGGLNGPLFVLERNDTVPVRGQFTFDPPSLGEQFRWVVTIQGLDPNVPELFTGNDVREDGGYSVFVPQGFQGEIIPEAFDPTTGNRILGAYTFAEPNSHRIGPVMEEVTGLDFSVSDLAAGADVFVDVDFSAVTDGSEYTVTVLVDNHTRGLTETFDITEMTGDDDLQISDTFFAAGDMISIRLQDQMGSHFDPFSYQNVELSAGTNLFSFVARPGMDNRPQESEDYIILKTRVADMPNQVGEPFRLVIEAEVVGDEPVTGLNFQATLEGNENVIGQFGPFPSSEDNANPPLNDVSNEVPSGSGSIRSIRFEKTELKDPFESNFVISVLEIRRYPLAGADQAFSLTLAPIPGFPLAQTPEDPSLISQDKAFNAYFLERTLPAVIDDSGTRNIALNVEATPTPTPTPEPTPVPEETPSPTPTPEETSTPTPTPAASTLAYRLTWTSQAAPVDLNLAVTLPSGQMIDAGQAGYLVNAGSGLSGEDYVELGDAAEGSYRLAIVAIGGASAGAGYRLEAVVNGQPVSTVLQGTIDTDASGSEIILDEADYLFDE